MKRTSSSGGYFPHGRDAKISSQCAMFFAMASEDFMTLYCRPFAEPKQSRGSRRLPRGQTAIDDDVLAVHIARSVAGEKNQRADNFVRLRHAAHRHPCR